MNEYTIIREFSEFLKDMDRQGYKPGDRLPLELLIKHQNALGLTDQDIADVKMIREASNE